MRSLVGLLVLGSAVTVLCLLAAGAQAVIEPAVTVDGPSEDIVGFGGVAMAEDGSGGLVYLKRVDGVAHVFVSRYAGGQWQTPMRVDTEQPYAASWPRIGAADGGELVVTWATPWASEGTKPVEEMLSSTLGPGAATFNPATILDGDIRAGLGTSPDLAMSPTGQADLVYRVVTETEGARASNVPLLRPGDVVEQVRVAHFNGERWSALGAINRNIGVSMRPPTAANAPQVAIGPTANALVVWQEPDIGGVARIWARRMFGANVNYVMPVSAQTFGSGAAAIEDDADAPSVALSPLGQAEVAYRQGASAGSPLPGPRIFLNILPDGESKDGSEFEGASVADNAVSGGKAASIGRPSIDIDERLDVRLLYDDNGQPRVIEGTDVGLSSSLTLGSPFVGSELTPAGELESASVMNPAGGGLSAWASADPSGNPAVAVREDFPGGGVQTALLAGGAGGPIGELAVGRSHLGDGLIAWQQGPLGNAAIVAAPTTAPPATFVISLPKGWIKPRRARVAWEEAASANPPLRYAVVLDGRELATTAGAFARAFNPNGLGDGSHTVQLLATDTLGQSVLTPASKLKIDGQPPMLRTARKGRTVTVRVVDRQSGANAGATRIKFGDGRTGHGKTSFRHAYPHPGVYEIVAHVKDNAGNSGTIRRQVSVR